VAPAEQLFLARRNQLDLLGLVERGQHEERQIRLAMLFEQLPDREYLQLRVVLGPAAGA
jgi:hypothetical protein